MSDQQPPPRPVFVYGTLCALPLLAWVLTGDASNAEPTAALAYQARVFGYQRFSLYNCDYPCVVKTDLIAEVDGYLLKLETEAQRKKLDAFEGESYKVAPVTVFLENGEMLEADMYVWDGDVELVSTRPWSLDEFIKERLQDWIDVFEGMELIGDN